MSCLSCLSCPSCLSCMRRPAALLAALLAIAACSEPPAAAPDAGDGPATPDAAAPATPPYPFAVPAGFPRPRNPAANPVTAAKAELGRHLFYDPRLSVTADTSCASCHQQARAFADARPVSLGAHGDPLRRNAPSLVNTAYAASQTWASPILRTLEDQAIVPLFGDNPIELGATGHEAEILARLRADPRYPAQFAAAFPDEPDPYTFRHVIAALATFQRTLIAGGSRYDRFRTGADPDALTAAERRGLQLFNSETLECHHCHGGFNFTVAIDHDTAPPVTPAFFNTGLYAIGAGGDYPLRDRGVFETTLAPGDMGKFKPPSLRNVALTAPYMHDGSVATLEEVLAIYERGGRLIASGPDAGDGRTSPFKSSFVLGFTLTPEDRAALLAFLGALTDEPLLTDPRFADPFATP